MQFYSGPSRRVLRRFSSDSNFSIDGIVDHEESREIYVKQSFTLQQKLLYRDDHYQIAPEWIFPYENEFNVEPRGVVPFSKDHDITDRFLLNKSFKNISFRPEGCRNFLNIENQSQIRLAPLLCSELNYQNVTKPPVITTNNKKDIPHEVGLQMATYNRVWFGAVTNMDAHVGVANRVGFAPYTVADLTANVAVAAGVGNHEIYTVYGFECHNIPSGQDLRLVEAMRRFGSHHERHTAGLIAWHYDSAKDRYYTNSFKVTIPFPLDQGDTYETFVVPSIHTRSATHGYTLEPYHYFYREGENNARTTFPTPIAIEPAGGARNETNNTADYVKVFLTRTAGARSYTAERAIIVVQQGVIAALPALDPGIAAAQAIIDGQQALIDEHHDIYMFVQVFRIVKGNEIVSLGRPRRFAESSAAVVAQPWLQHNATPMSQLVVPGDDLASQVPFWADYLNHVDFIRDLYGDSELFEYHKVGHIGVINAAGDTDPMFLLNILPDADLPASFRTQLAVMVNGAVTNRNAAAGVDIREDHPKEIFFLWKDKTVNQRTALGKIYPHSYGFFRVRLNELNTFRNAAGNFNGSAFNGKVVGGGDHALFRAALWSGLVDESNGRAFQLDVIPNRGGLYFKQDISPFRSENAHETANRIDNAGERVLALQAAALTSESQEVGKPFNFRSVYNFTHHLTDAQVDVGGANPGRPALQFPQRQLDGTLLAADLAFYTENRFELFIPVKKEVPNTLARPTKVTVECIEPFFGYCGATTQLECQHPMDTKKYGRNYPLILQDMSYTYQRDATDLFVKGYKNDNDTVLEVNSVSPPEFTTISEKRPGVKQQNKSVMRIAEVTPTFNHYEIKYGGVGVEYGGYGGVTPKIEIETRSGMFEYLFMWINFMQDTFSHTFPQTDPIITSIQLKVRGRENLFVRQLDADDIERISRENCHRYCNWRVLHNSGQGILLHLRDIGLTEEVAFPERKRIQMEITLLSETGPDIPDYELAGYSKSFNVVLIRQNQLFQGDVVSSNFVFLNENN